MLKLSTSIALALALLCIQSCTPPSTAENNGIRLNLGGALLGANAKTAEAAGTISGRFQVNGNGAATYTIPIEVPPGTNGVSPSLSLTYNSQQKNGLLGVGWSLTGLSTITRCPQTTAIDGKVDAINFDYSDRFCVDGQRLILTNNKLYGRDGATYRTEKDTFIEYTSKGTAGKGPTYFIAVAKDGSTRQYGTTGHSRIEAQGKSEVRVWAMNKITDRNGNYVSVDYTETNGNGEYYPAYIQYTGNNDRDAKLSPQRQISFSYKARPDTITQYTSGSVAKITKRLTQITTYVDLDGDGKKITDTKNLVKKYTLAYENGVTTNLSRITKITECGKDHNGKEICIPGTTFGWDKTLSVGGEFILNRWITQQGGWEQSEQFYSGDYNGDGLTDIAYVFKDGSKISWDVQVSDGKKFSWQRWATQQGKWQDTGYFYPGDYNGDGLMDIAYIFKDGNNISIDIHRSNGTSFVLQRWATQQGGWEQSEQFYPGDYNGDGLTDIAYVFKDGSKISWDVQVSDGKEFSWQRWATQQGGWQDTGYFYPGDYNGDGLTDIAYIFKNVNNKMAIDIHKSSGKSFINERWQDRPDQKNYNAHWQDPSSFFIGDFNADGLTDIGYIFEDDKRVSIDVHTSSGQLFTSHRWFNKEADWHDEAKLQLGDYNGDGITDIAYVFQKKPDGHLDGKISVDIYASNGKLFKRKRWVTDQGGWQISGIFIPSDYNNDGLIDIAYIFNNKNKISIDVHAAHRSTKNSVSLSVNDVITTITNGLKGNIDIQYQPLTDASVYKKSAGAKKPQINTQPPLYVVSKHSNSDGLGHTYAFTHHYEGAKANRQRGWLGFSKSIVKNLQAGTERINMYHQDFPYIGLVKTTQERYSSGNKSVLGESRNVYKSIKQKGVYTLYQESVEMDHYTASNDGKNSQKNYTLRTQYTYDKVTQSKLIATQSLMDHTQEQDNLYRCYQYHSGSHEKWWQGYFPIAQKTLKTGIDCSKVDFTKWNPSTDLSWQKFGYDGAMNLNMESTWDDHKNKWITYKRTYDTYGNLISSTDPLGHTSTITYDSKYRTFPEIAKAPKLTSGNQLQTVTTYEPKFGIAIKTRDFNNTVQFQIPAEGIDGFGRITRANATDSNGNLEHVFESQFIAGNKAGMQTKVWHRERWGHGGDWDPNNQDKWLWQKDFADGLGREYQHEAKGIDTGVSVITQVIFDSQGRVQKKSLPYYSNQKQPIQYIQYEYNIQGQPTKTIQPNGAVQEILYTHLDDREISRKTPSPSDQIDGHAVIESQATANSRGWLIHSKAPDGSVVHYEYDALGRQTKITDPIGVVTQFTYNSLGQVLTADKPSLGKSEYTYYDNGQLHTSIDANKQKQELLYDAMGRTTHVKSYKNQNGSTPELETVYRYDEVTGNTGKGRLTTVSTSDIRYTYRYDVTGAVASKVTTLDTNADGHSENYTTGYTYDALGRLLDMTYPDSSVVRYSYDAQGQVSKIQQKDIGQTNFNDLATYANYTSLGKFQDLSYRNGVTSNYNYDVVGRMQTSSSRKGALTLRDFHYNWNKANKLITITDQRKSQTPSLTQTFAYNEMGRLTTATGPYGRLAYDYDSAGNITQYNDTHYKYDGHKKHQLTQACNGKNCNINLKYDNNGNVTSKSDSRGDTWYYTYDAKNRLSQVEQATQKAQRKVVNTFTYDGSGRRIIKAGIDGTKTYYVSSLYEITRTHQGKRQYTRYTYGPNGVISATTKADPKIAAWQQYQNHDAVVGSIKPDSLGGGLAYLWAKIAQAWSYPNLSNVLFLVINMALAVLLGLALGWIIVRSAPTNLSRYHRWSRKFVPLVLTSFVFTSLTLPTAEASMQGDGIPEIGQTRYFHQDHLGSSTLITDETGAETNRIIYKPYGEIDAEHSRGEDTFRPKFTGKEFDSNIGLTYFGARYYDQSLGRFLTPDPAGQFFSPYMYGADDPEAHVDPDGRFAFLIGLAVVALSAYFGGQMANHSWNPAHWNWKSAKTWVGIAGGAVLGIAGGVAGVAVAEAGFGALAGVAAIEGTAWSGMQLGLEAGFDGSHFSVGQVFSSLGIGAAFGVLTAGVIEGGGQLLGKGLARWGARASGQAAEEAGEEAGAEVGALANRESREGAAEGGCSSFVENTKIVTKEGAVDIEDIEVGDEVWSYNETTGTTELKPVSQLFRRVAEGLVILTLGTTTIQATEEHPFYVPDKGWVEAANLEIGDAVLQRDGQTIKITAIAEKTGEIPVYNFEVADNHSYFIGEQAVLVHNGGGGQCMSFLFLEHDDYDEIHASIEWREEGGFGQGTNNAARFHVQEDAQIPQRVSIDIWEWQDHFESSFSLDSDAEPLDHYSDHESYDILIDDDDITPDAGHIISRQLGGGRDLNNMFPQAPSRNRGGPWRAGERRTYAHLQEFGRIFMTARIYY